MSVPSFIAAAIAAQGKTTVAEVEARLAELTDDADEAPEPTAERSGASRAPKHWQEAAEDRAHGEGA